MEILGPRGPISGVNPPYLHSSIKSIPCVPRKACAGEELKRLLTSFFLLEPSG